MTVYKDLYNQNPLDKTKIVLGACLDRPAQGPLPNS